MAGESQDRGSAWRLAGLGVEFIGVFGIFLAAGWWLDHHYRPNAHTPIWTLVGAGVGFIGAMYHLITEALGRHPWTWAAKDKQQRRDAKIDERERS